MSREIKFRAWDEEEKEYYYDVEHTYDFFCSGRGCYAESFGEVLKQPDRFVVEQFTGLMDKNGKEIYENCELDGRYRVEYIAPKFVGKDIIKGDIIELYDNKFTITKEHCEISQNSERGIN